MTMLRFLLQCPDLCEACSNGPLEFFGLAVCDLGHDSEAKSAFLQPEANQAASGLATRGLFSADAWCHKHIRAAFQSIIWTEENVT